MRLSGIEMSRYMNYSRYIVARTTFAFIFKIVNLYAHSKQSPLLLGEVFDVMTT